MIQFNTDKIVFLKEMVKNRDSRDILVIDICIAPDINVGSLIVVFLSPPSKSRD